jgi:hypothetical protein
MPSPKRHCDCVKCYDKDPVQHRTWWAHQQQMQAGALERHVASAAEEDDVGDDNEGDEGDEGEDEEDDQEEYEGQHAIEDEDWEEDRCSPEFQFAAQVVAEVAKGRILSPMYYAQDGIRFYRMPYDTSRLSESFVFEHIVWHTIEPYAIRFPLT